MTRYSLFSGKKIIFGQLTLMQAFNLKKSIEDNLNRSRRQLCKLEDEHNSALIVIKDQETKIQSYEDTVSSVISHISSV